MSEIKLEPVYFNSNLSTKTFEYLKNQKYLKFAQVKKFINNNFLNEYPFGFVILDRSNKISGFLGTMFSSRSNKNEEYIFCNLHTWIIDEKKRLAFFAQGRDILTPIFAYNSVIFAQPVNALIRLFLRYYKMKVCSMKYRISFLPKIRNLFHNKKFYIVDDEEAIKKKLSLNDIKIYNDHKKINCYKFLICDKTNKDNNIFVIASKKRKKIIFSVLEFIYVSNTEALKENWKNFIFQICKKFKIIFCSQNYFNIGECCIPENEKVFEDLENQVVVKNLPTNFKFNTLYSEFVY